METTHELTLKFDDNTHSLTKYNGLNIGDVGELLASLSVAIGLSEKNKATLYEISGNCYAMRLNTTSLNTKTNIFTLHENISKGYFAKLTKNEKEYTKRLQSILSDRLYMEVYDKGKSHSIRIEDIVIPELPEYYYEINDVSGYITSIGGKSLDDLAHIKIDTHAYNIYISPEQELDLLIHYKKNRVSLSIKAKISFETHKIKSADLLNFEILKENTFYELALELRNNNPQGLFSIDIDPLDKLLELRKQK